MDWSNVQLVRFWRPSLYQHAEQRIDRKVGVGIETQELPRFGKVGKRVNVKNVSSKDPAEKPRFFSELPDIVLEQTRAWEFSVFCPSALHVRSQGLA